MQREKTHLYCAQVHIYSEKGFTCMQAAAGDAPRLTDVCFAQDNIKRVHRAQLKRKTNQKPAVSWAVKKNGCFSSCSSFLANGLLLLAVGFATFS